MGRDSRPEQWRRAARLRRPDVRDDVDDELRFHLEMRARELTAAGLDPTTARAEAERRFGDLAPIRDACVTIDRRHLRRTDRTEVFTDMLQDLRLAARTLRATPGFTAVAVLTLALGIAATTAIYSVVDAVLLRPLPYTAAERLVVPQSYPRGTDERWRVSYRDYRIWRDQGVFATIALYETVQRDLTGHGQPVRTTAARITGDFFATLGVRPLLGRLPGAGELGAGGENPIVLSHGLWQRHFGGRQDVIGTTVRIRGELGTIVGVLPPNVGLPKTAELWYALPPLPEERAANPDNFAYLAIARLAPGTTLTQTRARLDVLARAAEQEFPAEREDIALTAVPLHDVMVGTTLTRALWVLLGAVGLVLLIACVNIANLLLARATTRGREFALRSALGASRGRMVRQQLVESLLLAFAGGALGLLLSWALIRTLIALAPSTLPRLGEVGLNGTVLLVTLGVTSLSALLFGLVPALQASGTRPVQALAEDGGRATGGVRSGRTASLLVVGEVALALTLLVGAGLLARSFGRLQGVDTGLETQRVLTFQITLPGNRYEDTQQLAFYTALRERLEVLPGVRSAGLTSALPLGGGGIYLSRTLIEAGAPEPPAGPEVRAMWSAVSPGFFRAMGQSLLAGRAVVAADDSTAVPVVVVNRRFAEMMYPQGDAIGQRVFSWRDERVAREIVGIVDDVRFLGTDDTTRAIVYVPLAQDVYGVVTVAVRTAGDPVAITAPVRRALTALDPEIAMARVRTMEDVMADSIAPQRFNTLLLGVFAALAALLAAVGLYGLLSYSVTQRTRELGVRVALGATRGAVLRLVLGRSLRLVTIGVALGLLGALALTRVLDSLLFEVEPTDPLTLAGVTLLLIAVALLASYLPARRAARVDPAAALRA